MQRIRLIITTFLVLGPWAANGTPILDNPTSPVDTGSYTSFVDYFGFAAFDAIQLFIVSDTGSSGDFEFGSVFEGFAGSVINPMYSLTTGAMTGTGTLQNFFTGDPIGLLRLDVIGWSGGVGGTITNLVGWTEWTNGVFSDFALGVGVLTCPDLSCYNTSTVPEPGTLALLGIGLAGMGLARRRKKV